MGVSQSNRRGTGVRSPRSRVPMVEVWPDGSTSHDGAPLLGAVAPQVVDPAELTVDQVLSYVAAHPDQRAAVLAAETAGKARKTILAALGD
jgi:hypothetical protein